jgi:leader peptidase (prepilin peptidase) / N-methyltransferase
MDIFLLIIFLFGLCWGSFLNVVGFRLVTGRSFFTPRSMCPKCNNIIFWYDNIPVLSWFLLKAKCRTCKERISILYPIFELLTAFLMALLYYRCVPKASVLYHYLTTNSFMSDFDASFASLANQISQQNYFSFGIFFIFLSALIVATRTDFQAMVIPQICTFWLIPIGLTASYFGLTYISAMQSFIGAVFGYGLLWCIAFLFKLFTRRDGLGIGDMEMLAMIGSFLGPVGVWFSLMLGSFLGLILGGLFLLIFKKDRLTRIPFGPFLSLGAVLYFLFDQKIIFFFWG